MTIQRKILNIPNYDARTYVQHKEPFNANNIYARTHEATADRPTDLYIVYSYGSHYPMFIAETFNGITKWYENCDKYSRTTSKHRSQSHPLVETVKLSTNDMHRMSAYGIAGVVAHKEF